jgi:hypothetical protein
MKTTNDFDEDYAYDSWRDEQVETLTVAFEQFIDGCRVASFKDRQRILVFISNYVRFELNKLDTHGGLKNES